MEESNKSRVGSLSPAKALLTGRSAVSCGLFYCSNKNNAGLWSRLYLVERQAFQHFVFIRSGQGVPCPTFPKPRFASLLYLGFSVLEKTRLGLIFGPHTGNESQCSCPGSNGAPALSFFTRSNFGEREGERKQETCFN